MVGLDHRSAPVETRDHLAEAPRPAVADLLPEWLWVSTCDRVELWAATAAPDAAMAAFRRLGEPTYSHQGAAALQHVFRVASSLESRVIGEPHVLGQLKAAQREAAGEGSLGPTLDPALAAAFACAKRVRSETAVGERPVSIAAAALAVLRDLFGAPAGLSGLLLGAGEMGEYIAEACRRSGVGFTVATRAPALTQAIAHRLAAHRAELGQLDQALDRADLVIAALGHGRLAIGRAMVEAALRRRRQRPILLLDLGLPSDVDPGVGTLERAFLYSLDELEALALAGRAGRDEAAVAAQRLVEAAVEAFQKARRERLGVPGVLALRAHFEATRQAVLSGVPAADAETATRLLINRLLHRPSAQLRADPELGAAARRLFALEEGTDE